MSNLEKESMQKFNIWGRACEINVVFDCFDDEEIDSIQEDAYIEFMGEFDKMMQLSYDEFERFCIDHYSEFISETGFDNIFKYIVPRTIYIQRNKDKVIGFICYFKFDLENNIAIKFVNNNLVEIGGEQIIL